MILVDKDCGWSVTYGRCHYATNRLIDQIVILSLRIHGLFPLSLLLSIGTDGLFPFNLQLLERMDYLPFVISKLFIEFWLHTVCQIADITIFLKILTSMVLQIWKKKCCCKIGVWYLWRFHRLLANFWLNLFVLIVVFA